MKRNFIIGKTINKAIEKHLPEIINCHKLVLDNPLGQESSDLELKIIIAIHANKCKKKRQLTDTENKSLKWVLRMYPELFRLTDNFYILLKFTQFEKEKLLENMKKTYNMESPRLSNIYRVVKIETKKKLI